MQVIASSSEADAPQVCACERLLDGPAPAGASRPLGRGVAPAGARPRHDSTLQLQERLWPLATEGADDQGLRWQRLRPASGGRGEGAALPPALGAGAGGVSADMLHGTGEGHGQGLRERSRGGCRGTEGGVRLLEEKQHSVRACLLGRPARRILIAARERQEPGPSTLLLALPEASGSPRLGCGGARQEGGTGGGRGCPGLRRRCFAS